MLKRSYYVTLRALDSRFAPVGGSKLPQVEKWISNEVHAMSFGEAYGRALRLCKAFSTRRLAYEIVSVQLIIEK